jgi:hypothetical protein
MKRRRKKNLIPRERLDQLKQADPIVYEIRCGTHDCVCGTPSAGCTRGFFSLFIQALNGIAFAKRFRIPYFVNFGNISYAYSQPGEADQNFWNYYFNQPIKHAPDSSKVIANELIETYPLNIWDREYIRRLAQIMANELVYQNEIRNAFDELSISFDRKKVLGVHFRSTDHPNEILPVSIDRYFDEVDERLSRYDHVFVATDDQHALDQFSKRYTGKLISNRVLRSHNGEALHSDPHNTNRYLLGFDALMECYALSLCNEAILTHSNLSYAALIFNPDLKYKLMERNQTRLKRLTTLTLYYLDKWNIRKW